MESCISLEELKCYLKIEHDAEDSLLQSLALSATSLVETRCNRKVIGTVERNAIATSAESVPASVKTAACIIAAFLYENRTATSEEIRSRVLNQVLLDQFINWGA